MTSQPRLPAGARQHAAAAGGRWTSKPVPHVVDDHVGFNDLVGEPSDWTERFARLSWALVTFTRSVSTDDNGNKTVTVTTDCDPPDMVLLARKGDAQYWNGDRWNEDYQTRKLWCADITTEMLREGLVDTAYPDVIGGDEPRLGGIQTAMVAASNCRHRPRGGVHVLTGAVAQLRGLRLLQSMAPAEGWETKLGDYTVPSDIRGLHRDCFVDAAQAYKNLPKPPWADGVPWGPQPVAGHATNSDGGDVFVGEHGDLLWRALTETDHNGLSPLKAGATGSVTTYVTRHLIAAAVLYDETAAEQLTSDLFVGVEQRNRAAARDRALSVFANAYLNSNREPFRHDWNDEQQRRIRGFIETVEGLEP